MQIEFAAIHSPLFNCYNTTELAKLLSLVSLIPGSKATSHAAKGRLLETEGVWGFIRSQLGRVGDEAPAAVPCATVFSAESYRDLPKTNESLVY